MAALAAPAGFTGLTPLSEADPELHDLIEKEKVSAALGGPFPPKSPFLHHRMLAGINEDKAADRRLPDDAARLPRRRPPPSAAASMAMQREAPLGERGYSPAPEKASRPLFCVV